MRRWSGVDYRFLFFLFHNFIVYNKKNTKNICDDKSHPIDPRGPMGLEGVQIYFEMNFHAMGMKICMFTVITR